MESRFAHYIDLKENIDCVEQYGGTLPVNSGLLLLGNRLKSSTSLDTNEIPTTISKQIRTRSNHSIHGTVEPCMGEMTVGKGRNKLYAYVNLYVCAGEERMTKWRWRRES